MALASIPPIKYSLAGHTHTESDVASLISDLGNKAAAAHSHFESDVVNLTTDLGTAQEPWNPNDHGVVAWSLDPSGAVSGSTPTSGTLHLIKLKILNAATITKFYWASSTAATTATSGGNWVGIYNSSGTLLASVGVDSDVTATAGLHTDTLSSTSLSANTWVWAAMLFNWSAGTLNVLRGAGFNTTYYPSLLNIGLSAASYRFATAGTSITTLPSSITPSSNTADGGAWWVAIG